MPNLQESIKNELLSALRTNMAYLEKDFHKNRNTNVCQSAYNLIDLIEKNLKNKITTFIDISSNIENFTKLISESNLFKWIKFDKLSDNQYLVKIEGCQMAQQCTHPRLNPENKICPMSLLAGSFLKYNNPKSKIFIEPSKFTPHDSETGINLIS